MQKLLKRKRVLIVVLVAVIIGLTYFEITAFAPNRIKTEHYAVKNTTIPEEFNGLKIAVFSDVYGNTRQLDKAISALELQNPDVVIFLGNLFNETSNEEDINSITESLSTIKAPLGKFAVLGKNDAAKYEATLSALEKSQFRLSQNRAVSIHNFTNSFIQFLFLDSTNTEQTYSAILESYDRSIPTLAFMNSPKIADAMGGTNVLVGVAGETLGGKVNIPFIGSLFFEDQYVTSDITVQSNRLLLSNGISGDEPNIRLFANPNILIITLKSSE